MRLRPLALVVVLGLSGCGLFNKPETPASLDTTATRVKTQLINQLPLAAAAINVDQEADVIYLRGFADDAATKQHIEAIARKIVGAQKIVNQIKVK